MAILVQRMLGIQLLVLIIAATKSHRHVVSIFITLTVLLLLGQQQSIYSQNPDSSNNGTFLNYTYPYYGVSIQYPSNWTYEEPQKNQEDSSIVRFEPPISNDPNLTTTFDVKTEKLNDTTLSLDQYARRVVNSYRDSSVDFSLLSAFSSIANTTLSGMPAYEIVFTDYAAGIDRKSVERGVIDHSSGSVYYLVFTTKASSYDRFIPILNKMIGSFEVFDSGTSDQRHNEEYIKGYNDGFKAGAITYSG
jgi:hypothetical protein